jgi:V/A-type H+-transporting ATPase subunit G/H
MDDVLKRLLEAESRAEVLIKEAETERDRLVQEARAEARTVEERFAANLPPLRAASLEKAEAQAAQALAELKRRYEEQHAQLRARAEQRLQETVAAAVALVLDPSRE